jgi:hypothetical protein
MDRITYKVVPRGKMWGIQSYQYGAPYELLNIQIFNQLQAEKFCEILNEETEEAYQNGQFSCY